MEQRGTLMTEESLVGQRQLTFVWGKLGGWVTPEESVCAANP